MNDLVSCVIPCRNESVFIQKCLESILNSDYPLEKLEVLVVDGMSSDGTREIVREYSKKQPSVCLVDNPEVFTPCAMNRGIETARGEYIVIMNAHTEYPVSYISKCIEWHKKLNADNVGGLLKTRVLHPNRKTNAILKILSHRFGVGNGHFRLGAPKPVIVDTAAYGCYKREIFTRIGLFNENLIRNQDMELNKRLARHGGKTWLIPEIECNYYVCETFPSLARYFFRNGLWILPTLYFGKSLQAMSIRHFIPMFFVLSLIIPPFFGLIHYAAFGISLLSLLAYSGFAILFSLRLCDKKTSFFSLLATFFTIHFAYGIGSLAGIFKTILLVFKPKKPLKKLSIS